MIGRDALLGLFPLDLVVLPGSFLPLHIFEPRYRALIADRLADDLPFGMVFGSDDDHAQIGCAVDITGVVQKLPDGKMNVVTRGYRRFRVLESVESERPYAVVRAVWLDDAKESVPNSLVGTAREKFRLVAQEKDWGLHLPIDVEDDPAALSWRIGDAMHLTPQARQHLLELVSPTERLETEIRWLDAAVAEGE